MSSGRRLRKSAGVEDLVVGLIVLGFALVVVGAYLWSTVVGLVAAGVALIGGGVLLAAIVGMDEEGSQ